MKRCVLTGVRRGKEEEEKTGGGGDRKEGLEERDKGGEKRGTEDQKGWANLSPPPSLHPSIPSHAGHL